MYCVCKQQINRQISTTMFRREKRERGDQRKMNLPR